MEANTEVGKANLEGNIRREMQTPEEEKSPCDQRGGSEKHAGMCRST